MNLILFESSEISAPLPRTDARAMHILKVLRRHVGDTFDCGLVDGPRGKATLAAVSLEALTLSFAWEAAAPTVSAPIILVIGLPRPQTARDLLRDATSLGVAALHFVTTDKGDPNYARSTLWSSVEWRRHLIIGAEQAFDTRLPAVTHGRPVTELVAQLPPSATRVVLDNYESPAPLSRFHIMGEKPVAVAFGPERGWSAAERDLFRVHGFQFAHLGARVLRTETAAIAAITLIRAKLGLL